VLLAVAYTVAAQTPSILWVASHPAQPGVPATTLAPDFQLGLPQDLMQGRRGVPDLSCDATIDGGVLAYYSGGWSGQSWRGPWGDVGGTSASAPEVAGMVAQANQVRSQAGKQPVGFGLFYGFPDSSTNSADFRRKCLREICEIGGWSADLMRMRLFFKWRPLLINHRAAWFLPWLSDAPGG
jgi:hypothetical protein